MGRRSSRVRRALKRMLLVAVLASVGGIVAFAILTNNKPQWYAPPSPKSEQVKIVADRTEYGVIQQAQKVRPAEEPWTMTVREDEVNAWLSSRLPDWIAHQHDAAWPEQLGTPQVHLQPGNITVAIPVDLTFGERMVVAELTPLVHEERLWLQLQSIALGTMNIPGDPVDALLSLTGDAMGNRDDDSGFKHIIDVLTGAAPLDTVFRLSDTREVRLLDVRCTNGVIDLTSRTSGPQRR